MISDKEQQLHKIIDRQPIIIPTSISGKFMDVPSLAQISHIVFDENDSSD